MAREKPSTRVGFASGFEPRHGETFDHRAVIYSQRSERIHWMESELARSGMPLVIAHDVPHVVAMLVGELQNLARPAVLVLDVDELTEGEVVHLHRIRESGWSGVMVVLGSAPPSLRAALGIDRTLSPPYVENALCKEIARHAQDSTASTVPIPIC